MNELYDLKRWGFVAVILFVLAWLFSSPEQSQVRVSEARGDIWSLEPIPRRPDLGSMAVQTAQASYWGMPATKEPEQKASVDLRWRIAGLVGREGAYRAMVSYSDPTKPNQLLAVGDTLPSGHRITRIADREVCVMLGKRSYSLPIQHIETE